MRQAIGRGSPIRRAWWLSVATLAHRSIASSRRTRLDSSSLRWRISSRTVRRPGGRWRLGSEGLVAGEHVPDRLGQSAGEVDLGDLGAALLADAGLRFLVARSGRRCGAGVGGGQDQDDDLVQLVTLSQKPFLRVTKTNRLLHYASPASRLTSRQDFSIDDLIAPNDLRAASEYSPKRSRLRFAEARTTIPSSPPQRYGGWDFTPRPRRTCAPVSLHAPQRTARGPVRRRSRRSTATGRN